MDRKETEIKERVSEWLNTTALWQKILCFFTDYFIRSYCSVCLYGVK